MIHTLEVDSVTFESGLRRILCGAYMRCETGKVTGLLGRNGSGKSCLMHVLYGELVSRGATVKFDGKVMVDTARHPKIMRYLPQHYFIPGGLSVRQIFRDMEVDFNDFVNLFPEFNKYYKIALRQLSGGERRIVEIFTVLASKTAFCLLDEPFSQVMPMHVELLREVIRRECENKGILITDHLYQDVIAVCDDLYVINGGKIYPVNNPIDLSTFGYTK